MSSQKVFMYARVATKEQLNDSCKQLPDKDDSDQLTSCEIDVPQDAEENAPVLSM